MKKSELRQIIREELMKEFSYTSAEMTKIEGEYLDFIKEMSRKMKRTPIDIYRFLHMLDKAEFISKVKRI